MPSLRRLPAFLAVLADIKATLCPRRSCILPAHSPAHPFQDAPPFVRCLKMSTHVACTDAHINLHPGTPCPSARKGWGNAGVDLGSASLERSQMPDLRASSQRSSRYLDTRWDVREAQCVPKKMHRCGTASTITSEPTLDSPTALASDIAIDALYCIPEPIIHARRSLHLRHHYAYLNRIHIAAIQNSTIHQRALLKPSTC